MKQIAVSILLAWFPASVAARAAEAQSLAIDLDYSKSKIAFVLGDVLHTVRGIFRLKESRIAFDPSAPAITGEIIVDAASGASGNGVRDRRMARDILEAQRYPEIRFMPTKIVGLVSVPGISNVEVRGSFLIHGQAHEVTIPMQLEISEDEITATGKFTVPYVQWGMKNPSTFLLRVNDKVEIDLTAIGHISRRQDLRSN